MRVYSVLLALTSAAYAAAQETTTPATTTNGAVTFKLPGVQTVTHVTLDPVDGHVTSTTISSQEGDSAVVAPVAPKAVSDKQGAFAGEIHDDEPRIDGDKAAFAGIDDHFRVAVNAVRVSNNLDPVVPDASLKLAAYRLAKDLATEDKPERIDTINKVKLAGAGDKQGAFAGEVHDDEHTWPGTADPLQYATEEGFQGTSVKAITHVEEASVGRKTTDREAAVLSSVGKWSASKDAFAGLEDPTHKSVGSMGYLADSGRAYYVTLLGK